MDAQFTLQNRGVYLRVDHAAVGAAIAAKHALRTDRNRIDCGFRVSERAGR